MNTTTAIQKLQRLLQNQDINFNQESDTLEESINEAIEKYNKDKPTETIKEYTGNGTGIYDLPATFIWNFSEIKQVEYPVDDTEPEKDIIAKENYEVYKQPIGTINLLLLDDSPEITEKLRVSYTALISTISDVLQSDQLAVLNLSAYFACLKEAQKEYNTTSDGQGLDFVNMVASGNSRLNIAKQFKMNYDNHIFGDPEEANRKAETAAGQATQQWNTETRWGVDRVFHEDDTD